ncbi:MAG: 2-hydroxyacyl-CoA dehydratase [Dehalococcoidaceae bacterium]|nr:2-hydroxyacyl-CoA dehydratase [Dehalococcoidaceae bacterium]
MSAISNSPGYNRLVFDTELKSFEGVLALLDTDISALNQTGKKLIAKSPLSPPEPIYAAGGLAYDAYTRETIVQSVMQENFNLANAGVDAGLSPEFNPWNLIMVGSLAGGGSESGLAGAAIACGCWDDQYKKSWQVLSDCLDAPVYFWEIPRYDADSEKWALRLIKAELEQLFKWLEFQTGRKVTQQSLAEAIRQGNMIRRDLQVFDELLQSDSRLLGGLEYYILQLVSSDYLPNPNELHGIYSRLIDEIRHKSQPGQAVSAAGSAKALRIYLMGDETQQFQLFNTIESCGGRVVGADFRLSLYYEFIDKKGSPLDSLARWIWKMPCNMPTGQRIRETIPFITRQKPDAVIINSAAGSRNLPGSERMVRDIIKEQMGIPVLSIETSLPQQDTEKTEYLVRAFIEMNSY